MKISDLKPSISELSNEEAFSLIKETRFQRRQLPPKKTRKKSTSLKTKRKKADPKAAVAAMSKEDRLKLIRELEGM